MDPPKTLSLSYCCTDITATLISVLDIGRYQRLGNNYSELIIGYEAPR